MTDKVRETVALLRRARQGDTEALGRLLELYRDYLRRRAERQLQGKIAVRVNASDVVQQTFLEAHCGFEQFLGQDEAALLSWLQRILDHNVAGAIRHHAVVQKRAIHREQSLDAAEGSKPPLKDDLDARQSTPSQRAMRGEDADRLEKALATLPQDQQQAVRLRHLEGWSLDRIAEHMGRSTAATASLIQRGVETLRRRLGDNF